MKRLLNKLTVLICVISVALGSVYTVCGAENEISLSEHSLKFTLPEGYTQLSSGNAAKMEEVIEGFGYTAASFKNYLTQNNIILFGVNEADGTQISLKCWETDFSKDVTDLSVFKGDSLGTVAAKIITSPGSSYKSVTVNGMRMFEVRKQDEDSGGKFYSVQYITLRNGKIYSLNFAFSGEKSESKENFAWECVSALYISDKSTAATWDFSSIFEMVLIWVMVLAALITIVVIFVSFVKDYKKRINDIEEGNDTIYRKKI